MSEKCICCGREAVKTVTRFDVPSCENCDIRDDITKVLYEVNCAHCCRANIKTVTCPQCHQGVDMVGFHYCKPDKGEHHDSRP